MVGPLREISVHFVRVAALIAGTWGLKRLLSKVRRQEDVDGVTAPLKKTRSYRFIAHPESQFQANTPPWLCNAANNANEGSTAHEPKHIQAAIRDLETSDLKLGEESLLDKLFLLQRDVARHYLNAGSYGGVYRLAAEAQKWYQDLLEHEPCYFNETIAPAALQAAKRCVAQFVGAEVEDLVHTTNATSAVNAVLLSTPLRPGDLVLVTSISYGGVRNAASRFAAKGGAGIVEVLFDLETLLAGQEAILSRFRSVLEQWGSRVRLAIIDHITSTPTIHMPVRRIADECKIHGIKVLVDGAHAFGALQLSVPDLGVHYYTSNLHKWGCAPKSAAFLWVEPSLHAAMGPLVTSHGYKQGFQAEFAWQGTSDISAWLAVPAALGIKRALGVQRLRDHNHSKLQDAVLMLWSAWGGQAAILGSDAPDSHMASIELPPMQRFPTTAGSAPALHSHLLHAKGIEVPISFWEDRLWVRISAQIYNTQADYAALRDAISELAAV